ncbi:molybdopterin-dependent oxidoreductase [Pendulispora albinea]|uniref:Molybdopterin-dependent oxidoreductase n=1 Tax=Pendulispora albinea TaxID=2741071 RepID=A0ABZ2M502_9BACT
MAETRLHTCMLCEAVCGVAVTVDSGARVLSIRGDDRDPFSRGHICPKAAALGDVSSDPDRIRGPMRRVGDRWEAISWDAALEEAGTRLAAVQKQYGRSALGVYIGNPNAHSYSAALASVFFGKLLGTRSKFSATSVDQLPQMLAALEMLGHQLLFPIPDVDRTDHLLMLGANPLASNGSLMTAPGIKKRLEALRARGGRLVVIDPRRTETAQMADAHHFIRPGGDAFLLLGMLHTIFEESLDRPSRQVHPATGWDELRRIARAFPPERVAGRTGMAAEGIRALARAFAEADRAVCYGRVGVCTQEFGALASWLVNALNVVTGNLDRAGGSMFTSPAVDLVGLATKLGQRGHFGVWKSRVRGLPEFGGELPAAVLAEEMETPGKGQIRALVTVAGNPVLSTPNGGRLDGALAKLDYMVSVDIYRNETTRHAHLILPTSFGLERDHYDLALYALAVRNAARYVEPALPAPPGVRSDWDVLFDLGLAVRRHGGGKPGRALTLAARGIGALGPKRMLDALLRIGPYRLSLNALRESPHGTDLGPLEPRLGHFLGESPVKLAPPLFVGDIPRLESALASRGAAAELVLIGRRHLRSNNSWMHNSLRLVKGKDGCTLYMHPDDAEARGLANGDRVIVGSPRARLETTVEVTDAIAPGVVSLPHGWGHDRLGTALRIARAHAGVSINDLTDEAKVDTLSGTASFSGVPITVERAAERAPAVSPARIRAWE